MSAPTVLLADADPDSRAVYAAILEHGGFRVLLAPDAASALHLARVERPAVIVAELFLPFVEGSPLPALLKDDVRTAAIPLLGLTAVSDALGMVPGLSACDGRLLKPCAPSLLLREVRSVLAPPRPAAAIPCQPSGC